MIKVNYEEIKFSKFPNNETHVDTSYLNKVGKSCVIDFKWEKDEDILNLCFILGHLEKVSKEIYIWYMPYSRMDRSQNGSCFTLKYVCEILNNFINEKDGVYVIEPHSDKTLQLLKNSKRINVITPLAQEICNRESIDIICYPDKGARARFSDDKLDKPIIYCEKIRDFNTGEIKGLDILSDCNTDLRNKNILILDDLCSKGGTFYHTAMALRQKQVNQIYLGVCHMEPTILQGDLYNSDVISRIYCLDTMLNKDDISKMNKLTIFNTSELIDDGKLIEVKNDISKSITRV